MHGHFFFLPEIAGFIIPLLLSSSIDTTCERKTKKKKKKRMKIDESFAHLDDHCKLIEEKVKSLQPVILILFRFFITAEQN